MKPMNDVRLQMWLKLVIAHAHFGADEYVPLQLQDFNIADILTKWFMYHKSCYRNICRIKKPVVNPEEIQDKPAREECFNDLKAIVQMKVIENSEFMRLRNVADI